MKTGSITLQTALLFGLSSSWTAQAVASDPIIVTATRTAQTGDQTLAPVTVINRDDIERQQATSVTELLRATPGVDFSNNGGRGKATSLFLRGTASDHVLVLIDGIEMGSATTGQAAIEDLPIHAIERIEIVRGPRSSLYGSEAIGGVIQIFTRKGDGETSPHAYVSGGSYSSYGLGGGVAGGNPRGWYNLNASGSDTEGFDAKNDAGHNPDRDGYQNLSAALRAGYRFSNDMEAELHWLRAAGETEFDGSASDTAETLQQIMGVKLSATPLNGWYTRLQVGRSQDESENLANGVAQSRFDTQRDSLSWQNDLSLGAAHLLTLGVDHRQDAVDSTTAYTVTERDNTALFGQYQGDLGDHDLQFSLRRDDNEQFDAHTTGSAAWGYDLSEATRLTVAYGTAFKAPSFNELYFPGYGDPGLQPEESGSVEVGIKRNTAHAHWSLHAYQTDIDNLIAFNAATFSPANIAAARIRGLEADAGVQIAAWRFNAGASVLDPEVRTAGSNQGNVLPRRAQRSLRLTADRAIGAHSIGATLVAFGQRYDDLANRERLAGYGVVALRAEYRLSPAWRAQLRIDNLFDRDYQTAADYNQPGRGAYLTVRYQP
ncbi:ligand-gated channel protein [Candidatus Tenderia electrophaga]|jgi:vitamin B12 transporter|uniref:Ligand-gated channel protein n=1 Tax=Candidatus Tenderia electrophaga TaxID=1748243 RepID=A0A0S2TCK4_9GAMM|nr:ligand-gated channel protein [Candidatus Tenderia electrophaga]